VPSSSAGRLLERLYPHHVMLGAEGQLAVKSALKVHLQVIVHALFTYVIASD